MPKYTWFYKGMRFDNESAKLFAGGVSDVPRMVIKGEEIWGRAESGWWSFDDATGLLRIYCKGDMPDYGLSLDPPPWREYADQITQIRVENRVTKIGQYAFFSLNAVNVYISDSVTKIATGAFAACEYISSLTIPGSVKTIEQVAFVNNEALTSVRIGEGVQTIGDHNFETQKLRQIYLPKSLQNIGIRTFLVTYYTEPTPIYLEYAGNAREFVNLAVRNQKDFYFCFSSTSSLELNYVRHFKIHCIVPSSSGIGYNEDTGQLEIYPIYQQNGAYLYIYPNGAISNFPEWSRWTQSKKDEITHIYLFDYTTRIGAQCFPNFKNLIYINIPDSVTSIGDSAFYRCYKLGTGGNGYTIFVPDSVTSIDDSAFRECTGLKAVIIGSGVTYIGNLAFYGCTSLTTVYYRGSEEKWNAISIGTYNTSITSARIYYNSNREG